MTPTTTLKEPYLTVVEAAEILRLHPETVRRLSREGEVPFHRSNWQYRYLRSELVRYMATKR
jgi:excisionase family DNA binding protein